LTFLHRSGGALAFQPEQSMVAIGSGGLFGRGLGRGLQKYFFLPDPHTDFILSILVEETGFLGLLALFLVTGFILSRVFILGYRCRSRFGELLCFGVGLQLLLAFLLHTAVCFGWAPTTGIPFPLVSFGGSALIANLLGLGLVMSVSRRRVETDPWSPASHPTWVRPTQARRMV
jgi:cell division protein FtsW (lipid II flippase)